MTEEQRDRRLAALLEEYHRRRAMGEPVSAEDFREEAGELFDELRRILEAEAALDASLAAAEGQTFPMPFGDYTLVGELGRGAMGVVYEAIHRRLGRKVALKVLRTGFDTHPSAIERFRREARACAQIRHDHVVKIFEAGEHDGRHFYAMELLPGKSLWDLANDGELPPPRELADGMADVVDALHALHEAGIIHRDIKPSNIMVEPDGRMTLADFGLARTVAGETLTQTGERLGTPLYMSPEQLLGAADAVNARSDIYGLGASLYEVVEGRPIYRTDDLRVLMRMILKERPEPPAKAPEGLARIIMKALEKENSDRYADAAAMRDDLRAFARGDAVEGRPLNAAERAMRTMRRNAKPLIAAAAVVVAAVVGFALKPPAPAEVTIACVPEAEVRLGDDVRGRTPLRMELAPGHHDVLLVREGFAERTYSLDLREGELRTVEALLVPSDPTDPDAIRELAAAFDIRAEGWEPLEVHRGKSADDFIAILLPRGDVRVEDLREFRFQIGSAFEQTGAIVFERGGKEIFRKAVDDAWPEKLSTVAELPEGVLDSLKRGARVTWGFHPESGKPETVSFRVVDPDIDRRLARIDSQLAGQDPLIARQLKAQLYLSKGLACAAYLEARAIVEEAPDAVDAYAVMRGALQKLDLKDSPLWVDLAQRTADLPGRRRDRPKHRPR